MNKSSLGFGLFFFLAFAVSSPAAELVRFPEGNKSWTVAIRYANTSQTEASSPAQPEAGGSAPQAVRAECASFDGAERYRITWSDKQTTEVWKQQGMTLIKDPATGRIGWASGTIVPGLIDNLDASLFSWITEAGPGTETTYEKRQCLLYQKNASLGNSGIYANAEDLRPREAWIDPETLRPIAYHNGLATFVFTYGQAPTGPLNMPDDFARLYARIQSSLSRPSSPAEKK